MTNETNIPVQVCTVTSTKGEITPLWCRFRNDEGEITKLDIIEYKQVGPGGIHTLFFECTAVEDERKIMFQLRYDPHTYMWAIVKKLL